MVSFKRTYRCYSISQIHGDDRPDIEHGGKIIMPPSALKAMTHLNIEYPMMFKLTNKTTNKATHCGVLEFVAKERSIYIPNWMMRNLGLEEEEAVLIESVSLPVATFSTFQPLSADFLDITDPKAVLEKELRNYACLTIGDVISINYNDKIYDLRVLQTEPKQAVSIIECDMNVEFGPPEEEKLQEPVSGTESSEFVPFQGKGHRLDGEEVEEIPAKRANLGRGIPDHDYKIGTLKYIRPANAQESL